MSQQALVLRKFRPPRPAQVIRHQGKPVKVIDIPVVACAGPWRTSGDWWAPSAWDREEWDVELAGGPVLRIYLDSLIGKWFLDGSYD